MQPNDLSTQLQELKNYLREELRKKFGGLESTGRPAYAISLANRDMTTFHKNRIEKDGDPLSFRVGGVMELHQPVSNTDLARAAHVLTLMMHWAKDRDWTLRAIGSAWSFSDVAAPGTSLTTSKCLLVETKAFAFYHRTSEDGLVYVTSGATVRDLNERLDVLNRCLATSGSSDGQTIAGAISTGVHGASFNGGAIHDSVRAFHMAGPDGDLLVCRDDASVTAAVNEVKAAFAVSELVVDEELFDAIAVSFGSFGFMIGMVLETQPKYALRVIRRSLPSTKLPLLKQALLGQISFGDVDAQLAAGDGDEPPHHCGLLINPYDPDTYKIVLMYPRRPDPSQPIFEWPDEISSFGVAIVRLLGPLLELADQAVIGPFVTQAFNDLKEVDAVGLRRDIFGEPNQPLPVHSVGVGVPIDRFEEALRAIHTTVADQETPGPAEVRFVGPSPALLAINRFAPMTCVIGFDGLDNGDAWAFSHKYIDRVRNAGIPMAFHWGKMNDLAASPGAIEDRLRDMYGVDVLDTWKNKRRQLLGDFAELFDNAFVRRLGMDG